jgi:hypothetical protein
MHRSMVYRLTSAAFAKSGVPAENNHHIVIGKENYFLSADGHLMPTRKDRRRI